MNKPKHECEKGEEFIFRNGSTACDIEELLQRLKEISDDEFYSHVTFYKNDFANWIRDVLKNKELAARIYVEKERKEIINVLENYLNGDKKKLKREVKEKKEEKESKEKREKRTEEKLRIKESKNKEFKQEKEIGNRDREKEIDILGRYSYSKIVRELLLKEYFFGLISGFLVAFIVYVILKMIQLI